MKNSNNKKNNNNNIVTKSFILIKLKCINSNLVFILLCFINIRKYNS